MSCSGSSRDIYIEPPDVYITDYRLLGNMNGMEVAIEILNYYSACISSLLLLNL